MTAALFGALPTDEKPSGAVWSLRGGTATSLFQPQSGLHCVQVPPRMPGGRPERDVWLQGTTHAWYDQFTFHTTPQRNKFQRTVY